MRSIGQFLVFVVSIMLGISIVSAEVPSSWNWGPAEEERTIRGGFEFHSNDAPGKYELRVRGRARGGRRVRVDRTFEMDENTIQKFTIYSFGSYNAKMIRIDDNGGRTLEAKKHLRVKGRFKGYASLHAGTAPDDDGGDDATGLLVFNDSGSNRDIDLIEIRDAGGGRVRVSENVNIEPGTSNDDGVIPLSDGLYDIRVRTEDGDDAWFLNERIKRGEVRRISVFQRVNN